MKEVGSPKKLFENHDLIPIQSILWTGLQTEGPGRPVEYNPEWDLKALMQRQLLQIPYIKDLVKRLRREKSLLEACGYYGTVLDLGCGAGRHSLHLQRQGHRVLAADISPLAVKIAEERGVKHATVANASTIEPGEMIDTVLLLGNGFGVYGTPQNAKHQLKRLHGFTSDDATVIMDTVDPHATDNPSHTEYHRKNIRQNRLVGQIRLRHRHRIANENKVGYWYQYNCTKRSRTGESRPPRMRDDY